MSTDGLTPESLRPATLDEMVGQASALTVLKALAKTHVTGTGVFPHLLFYGPPGTGKTTAAYAVARAVLNGSMEGNFREINASNERGIKDVREVIGSEVDRMPSFGAPFKFLLLDEADHMTPDAQAALRRIMEQGSDVTRFILTCNRFSRLLPALRSRCLCLPFRPLSDAEVREVIARVSTQLGIQRDTTVIDSIVARVRGQARDAVNVLIGGGDDADRWVRIDERIVELLGNGKPAAGPDGRIESFVGFLRAEGVTASDDLEDVLFAIHEIALRRLLVPAERFRDFAIGLAEAGFRCREAGNPLLQIRGELYRVIA